MVAVGTTAGAYMGRTGKLEGDWQSMKTGSPQAYEWGRCLAPPVRACFNSRMSPYLHLAVAITAEVIATSALRASEGFSRIGPSLIVVIGYAIAFYALSLTLKAIPVGIAYAIWSGVGIILITGVAWALYGQKIDAAGLAGIALIIAGVAVINLFSKSVG